MIAKPILDNFEIKGIQDISAQEKRALTEHRVPGMEGSLFHDMGAQPALITIRGSLNYNESRQDVINLEELRRKFHDAKAVPFVADITTATKVKEVLIKYIEIKESEKLPDYFDYFIELKEHAPEFKPGDVQADVNLEATTGFNNMLEGVKAESSLKDFGLDSLKVSTLLEEIDPGALNGFMGQLDKLGLSKLSDLFKFLPEDLLASLAKALGISLPLGGYNTVLEVLNDLTSGAEKILGEKSDKMAASAVSVFGIIIAKLLISILMGSKDINWGELADKFKSGLKELS